MNSHKSQMQNAFHSGGQIAGYMVAMILGFTLMLIGMGMGVTLVLLPLGLPIGLVGLLLFVWGLSTQVRSQRDEDQSRLPPSQV